jgi:DNA polymerase III subunit chi
MSMPAIYFVRLERQEKALHVARLAEACFNRGQRLLIVVANEEMSRALDRYLWTWKKDSFLPHTLINTVDEPCDEAIVISPLEHNPNKAEVLICVSPCSPKFFKGFQLIYDFAETYDSQLADAARERFRLYRQQGFEPQLEASSTST